MVFVTDQTFTIVSRSQAGLRLVGVPTPNVRDEFTSHMTAIDAPTSSPLSSCRSKTSRNDAKVSVV